jgi:uncharacterized protein with PQ loop repeat
MSTSVSIQTIGGGLDLHTLAVGAGYLGATLGVLMVAPQIARTLRDRARPGVSAMSWSLTALSCLTWLLYGIRAGEPPQIPGNVFMVSGAAFVVLSVPSRLSVPARAVRLALPAAILVTLAFVIPAAALGFVAFGIGLVSALPQLITSLAGRERAEAESGVSVLSWLLRAASQVSWLIYAIALHDLVVTISATFILASALLLVLIELSRRSSTSAANALAQGRIENVEACV